MVTINADQIGGMRANRDGTIGFQIGRDDIYNEIDITLDAARDLVTGLNKMGVWGDSSGGIDLEKYRIEDLIINKTARTIDLLMGRDGQLVNVSFRSDAMWELCDRLSDIWARNAPYPPQPAIEARVEKLEERIDHEHGLIIQAHDKAANNYSDIGHAENRIQSLKERLSELSDIMLRTTKSLERYFKELDR